jgi:hypothetical protein
MSIIIIFKLPFQGLMKSKYKCSFRENTFDNEKSFYIFIEYYLSALDFTLTQTI